ncbi:hypothetical protein GCM10007424_05100 [Flavobacterium suaedae]|uniref:DUF1684 domain-containing protein n=1 Tax=Flavobacterium suaedae TaxID=1767027 RepID=A0ABQ1JJI9_9FLAO|nr:DUF1684 domain-containing protein [Flavobacterium suaedae]GGB68083.1 hypothetical protein GCM10007424_05100 [Flavobacterium suaedae]
MRKLILALLFLSSLFINAQECSEANAVAFQKRINSEYANPEESPLTKKDLKHFKSLDFYPIDTAYCVTAKLVRTPDEKPFEMHTSTRRKPLYVKYGELHFTLKGKKCKLDVFRNVRLSKMEKYKDYLFLPFTDLTSGNGSYGGGRYIDLTIPEGDIINIDFNTAYNPYCAYNHDYSCPVPPEQNDLLIEIKAGVKAYKN